MNRQDQTTVKMIVPGIIQALAVSPCGNYCVGGAAEQLFVWQVSTGRMMACLRRHYQNVNSVFFTSDSANFVSIGAEGLVLLWNMETVLGSSSVIYIFLSFILSC
jgi:pre-rRNA-processing protein IPI3